MPRVRLGLLQQERLQVSMLEAACKAPQGRAAGPQGGQLWVIWLGDDKAGLIFNMGERTEAQ